MKRGKSVRLWKSGLNDASLAEVPIFDTCLVSLIRYLFHLKLDQHLSHSKLDMSAIQEHQLNLVPWPWNHGFSVNEHNTPRQQISVIQVNRHRCKIIHHPSSRCLIIAKLYKQIRLHQPEIVFCWTYPINGTIIDQLLDQHGIWVGN